MAIIKGTNKNDILDGTPQADVIRGKRGNDLLSGLGGNDTLCGGDGNDTLDGGIGNDRMFGGKGHDIYYVDSDGDRVVERGREGTDEVRTSLDSYALGANVENLTFVGTGDFTGTGTSLNNIIKGGDGINMLQGGKGDDALIAGISKLDTAIFAGKSSDYEIVTVDGVTTVTDKNLSDGDDGQDTLTAIERLQFSDKTVPLVPPEPVATIELGTLDGDNGFRMYGSTKSEGFGTAVSAGDINNDGFDDLIVTNRGTAASAAATYVVFGKASGWDPTFDPTTLDGMSGFRINGELPGDVIGGFVAGMDDVNGDGVDDLIIGAPNADPNGFSSGTAYVVFGKSAGWDATFDLSSLDGDNGFRVDGPTAESFVGRSVASAGDVNGDGIGDIIIGAVEDDSPNIDDPPGSTNLNGKAYVIFGTVEGWDAAFDLASLDGTNGFRVDGEDITGNTARSVSSAGDINGDGFDDVFIGATDANGYQGAAYVVFGKASGWSPTINLGSLDGTNGFELIGRQIYDFAGFEVRSGGDINGDGLDDMIVAARLSVYSPEANTPAYVVFGKASGWSADLDLGTLDGTNGFLVEGTPDDISRPHVAGGGDFNGDGLDDFIVTANTETYLVYGKESGWDARFDLPGIDGTNGFRLLPEGPFQTPESVSFAGDVNKDGYDDLIVGIPNATSDTGEANAGASYVVFGRSSTNSVLSTAPGDGATLSVSDVLDVSGGSDGGGGGARGGGQLSALPAARTTDPVTEADATLLAT